MASKFCFNPDCNVSISHDFKNGWRLRNFAFANLCHRCGSIYEEGRFCEVFHKYATGWRCCETCGKRVHCGCIVSIHAFVFLDAGGIECMICARKNVPLTPNQMCPPQSLPNWLMQSPVRNWSQTPRSASNKLWHQGENFFNKPCTYLKLGSRTSFEVDMSTEFERLFLSDRIAALPPKRNQTQNFSFSNGRLKHNGPENPGYERTVVNCDKEACHQHPVHQCFLKDGQWKLLTASLHNVDSSCQSQICEFKTVEARVRKELLARYQPKTSDEELQQISGSPHSIIIPMFEKTLSTSDANRIGRMVLPKVYAEAYFPPISQSEGLPLKFEDINGKEWTFQFRYWINNNSRMYVLEGVSNCIQSLQLQAGDTVSFGRTEPQGKLILGFRKASSGLLSQGTLAGKSGNEMHIGVDGNQKPKFKEDPTKCHSKVNRATGGSSSIPFERKNSTLNAKRKRSKVDNMGLLGLKLTLEEAQRLLRSPPNHDPHVVIIEDFEFEEFEDAPVIGRPTIIVRGSLGEAIQWAQCDNCMKWRKLPFDYLLPAKWTCTENVWDPERSSCDAAQELSVKQLRDLLSIHNPGLRLDSISAEDGSDKAIKKLLQVSVSARMFCKPIILTPSASSSRTSEMKGKMSREEILARAKRKRDSSEVPSGSTFSTPYVKVAAKEADKQQPDPTVTAGVSARLRARNPVVDVVDTYDLSLPPDFLVIEGLANGIWPDAEKLLFPAAKERLDSLDTEALNAQTVQLSLQCVQNGLSLRLRLSQLAKENASLNEKVKRLQEQFLKAKQAKEQAERSWKESEAAREEMEARLQQVEVEWQQKEAGLAEVTDRLSSQVAGLQEELKDQEAEIIMRVRASMANKFLLGKTDTKYLQSVVDDYLRFGSIKDLESEGKRRKGRRKT